MGVRDRALKDYRSQQRQANDLYLFFRSEIQKILKQNFNEAIALVASTLAVVGELNYMTVKAAGIDKRLHQNLQRLFELTALEIEQVWEKRRRMFALHAAMLTGYVSRKNQPPWIPVNLNLNGIGTETAGGSWRSLIHFHMRNMADAVNKQVGSGLIAEEDLHAILNRVRKTLGTKNSMKESYRRQNAGRIELQEASDEAAADTWSATQELFGKPPVSISEGTYTLEDVRQLQSYQDRVMGWKNREYNPDDKLQWERNKYMMDLERTMVMDAQYLMNETGVKMGSDNLGIQDFTWVVSKPQLECDACTDRDGMTLNEITKKFGTRSFSKGEAYPADLPQNSPPPLHPHCRCQVVPKLRDEWAKDTLKKEGYEWDQDSGIAFNPNKQQQQLGFQSMSWDQWMSKVGGL